MNNNHSEWKVPNNLRDLIKDSEDNSWEQDSCAPLILTVSSGIAYKGRDLDLCWQIEFDPYDDFFEDQSDGYIWSDRIKDKLSIQNPKLSEVINTLDTEDDCCVIWVENEQDCKTLFNTIWALFSNPLSNN